MGSSLPFLNSKNHTLYTGALSSPVFEPYFIHEAPVTDLDFEYDEEQMPQNNDRSFPPCFFQVHLKIEEVKERERIETALRAGQGLGRSSVFEGGRDGGGINGMEGKGSERMDYSEKIKARRIGVVANISWNGINSATLQSEMHAYQFDPEALEMKAAYYVILVGPHIRLATIYLLRWGSFCLM